MNAPTLVVLIPAHQEEQTIAATIEAALNQTRPADRIIVIPNGCTDQTANIARQYPVTVQEHPKLAHRKSEALNRAWTQYAQHADTVICLDADTVLPTNAFHDWEQELQTDPNLGGSSSKFTAQGTGFIGRLQKNEYAAWADICLRKGSTRVISGTGSALRGETLREIAATAPERAPWSYNSAVEDFFLTYQMRRNAWHTHTSPTVRAYTDTMPNLRALWAQRVKWGTGTLQDLLRIGINRHTWQDWATQAAGAVNVLVIMLTLTLTTLVAVTYGLTIIWWWLALPALIAGLETRKAYRIPHYHWQDIALAASLAPTIFYMGFRAALFLKAWATITTTALTKKQSDLWATQYVAEGK